MIALVVAELSVSECLCLLSVCSPFWSDLTSGGVLQTAAYNLGTLITGRIISGFGLGIDVATVPTWQSECSKPHRRGQLVMIEGAMCTIGLACAQWIGFAVVDCADAWRDPRRDDRDRQGRRD